MSVLTDMTYNGLFLPASSWIMPFNKQGVDNKRMCAFFKSMVNLVNCTKDDVTQVFMKH